MSLTKTAIGGHTHGPLSAGQAVPERVITTIEEASRSTGVSFSFLMAQAHGESRFETDIKNRASSATGLFQFTKGTWLAMVKAHGAAHGIGDVADKITRNAAGAYVVTDPEARKQILELRKNPELSAMMAAELTRDNKITLEHALGRPVGVPDLALAAFLGPSGALHLLKAKAEDPNQPAANLLPAAAKANPSIFYGPDNQPRTVASVYDHVRNRIENPMHRFAALEPTLSSPPHPAKLAAYGGTGQHNPKIPAVNLQS